MDQAAKLRKLANEKSNVIRMDKGNVTPDESNENEALAKNPARFPKKEKKNRSRIIAVTSGKGGVGKTSISVNLAIMLSKMGQSVTLLDADLGLANINVILGFIPKYTLQHVFKGQKTLSEILIEVPEGIKLIAGASGFYQLANVEAAKRQEFIESFQGLDTGDVVIIDTAAGVSENVLSFVLASDEALVITTPEPTAITDAYGIIKAIASQTTDMSIKLVVNRATSALEAKRVAERVINIAGQFLSSKVENIGFIYDDPIVAQAVRNQKPFCISHPKSKASGCIRGVAANILDMDISMLDDSPGFFSKFMKIISRNEN